VRDGVAASRGNLRKVVHLNGNKNDHPTIHYGPSYLYVLRSRKSE